MFMKRAETISDSVFFRCNDPNCTEGIIIIQLFSQFLSGKDPAKPET